MNWGLIIKELLQQRGMSHVALAKKAGLSEAYISRVCKGKLQDMKSRTLEKLAKGLSMSFNELNKQLKGEPAEGRVEQPEQILERYRVAMPISVPVYDSSNFGSDEPDDPIEYIPIARSRIGKMNCIGYEVQGISLLTEILEGDIIIIDIDGDREGRIDPGDVVACLYNQKLLLGRLHKIADELFLETSNGRKEFEKVAFPSPVIEVRKKLK